MKSLLTALLLSSLAFAQHDMQKSQPQKSEAQKSFDILKTLAGSWQGAVSVDPPQPAMGEGTVTRPRMPRLPSSVATTAVAPSRSKSSAQYSSSARRAP